MQASELRIGNYVWHQLYKQIYTIDADMIKFAEMYKDEPEEIYFEPIPLSEKWLLRFGFNNGHKNEFHAPNRNIYLSRSTIRSKNFYWSQLFGADHKITIQYVHQLQNLYFSLTGQELIMREGK